MKTATHIFILFFLLLTASNIAFAQEKKEEKKNEDYVLHTNPSTKRFTQLSPPKDTIIMKGSEVKFSFEFGEEISYVELVGVGRASRADIKAGKWEVVVKPKKSIIYRVKYKKGTTMIEPGPLTGTLVVVVNSKAELEKAQKKLKTILNTKPHAPIGYKNMFL